MGNRRKNRKSSSMCYSLKLQRLIDQCVVILRNYNMVKKQQTLTTTTTLYFLPDYLACKEQPRGTILYVG
jgi:hypothetical protein